MMNDIISPAQRRKFKAERDAINAEWKALKNDSIIPIPSEVYEEVDAATLAVMTEKTPFLAYLIQNVGTAVPYDKDVYTYGRTTPPEDRVVIGKNVDDVHDLIQYQGSSRDNLHSPSYVACSGFASEYINAGQDMELLELTRSSTIEGIFRKVQSITLNGSSDVDDNGEDSKGILNNPNLATATHTGAINTVDGAIAAIDAIKATYSTTTGANATGIPNFYDEGMGFDLIMNTKDYDKWTTLDAWGSKVAYKSLLERVRELPGVRSIRAFDAMTEGKLFGMIADRSFMELPYAEFPMVVPFEQRTPKSRYVWEVQSKWYIPVVKVTTKGQKGLVITSQS